MLRRSINSSENSKNNSFDNKQINQQFTSSTSPQNNSNLSAEEFSLSTAISNQANTQNNRSKMNTSSRDRTSEFHSTIRSFQSRMSHQPVNSNLNNQKKSNSEVLQQHSRFTLYAKKIGKDLSNTCIKLEKLTDLAKKRTLFEDRSKEIQDLTFHIKQDINNLHSAITQLQEFVKNTNHDHGNKNMQKHSNSVVYTLQSKLAYMSKDFKQVLEVRSENMKQQTERGEQYFSKNTMNPSNAASMFQPPKMPGSSIASKSVLLYDGSGQSQSNNETNGGTVLNMEMMEKQQVQQRLILTEDTSHIQDRANAMQTVETTIVELGTMFNQLATMIKEQEEQIQRIDSNVDDVDMNVSAAHTELLKYFQSVTSNRWLMIKVFCVLIAFFVFFIVVMT